MRDDLPGMWEDADLSGGWADSQNTVTDETRGSVDVHGPRTHCHTCHPKEAE